MSDALYWKQRADVWQGRALQAEVLRDAVIETLPSVLQLLDGWHADGTAWTEWDEKVRLMASGLLMRAHKYKPIALPALLEQQPQRLPLGHPFNRVGSSGECWNCRQPEGAHE
jgi:hypothetical protein